MFKEFVDKIAQNKSSRSFFIKNMPELAVILWFLLYSNDILFVIKTFCFLSRGGYNIWTIL